MFFESFSDAINMAGHGVYVWSAYGVSFVVLAVMAIQPLLKHRRQCKQLQARHRAAAMSARSS